MQDIYPSSEHLQINPFAAICPRFDDNLVDYRIQNEDDDEEEYNYCASTGYTQTKEGEPVFTIKEFPREYDPKKRSLFDGPIMLQDGTLLPRKRMRPWKKLETHSNIATQLGVK